MSTQFRIRSATLAIVSFTACGVFAQTKINLQNQSQAVDFSAAPSTKPAQTGFALPESCGTGAVFVSLADAPGKNVYVCTSPNTWSQQSGGGKAPDVRTASGNVLSIGANCSLSSPCNIRIGTTVFAFVNGVTATVTSGTGTAYVYVSSAGQIIVGHNMSISCALGCVAQDGITGFPTDAYPIAIWTATTGVWSTNGTDVRAAAGRDLVVPGNGLTAISTPNTTTLNLPVQKGGFSVAFRGTDVAAGQTVYVTVPYACTITDWAITSDGAATIALWSGQDGTIQIPTDADALTTSGLALTTGKRIHSTALTDFISTQIFAFDTIGVNLLSVGGSATHVEFSLGCTR